jgi:hypothetical protein
MQSVPSEKKEQPKQEPVTDDIAEKIRVRIMQEAYDLADRNDSEGYNSVKVMCSDVLALLPRREWVGLTEEEYKNIRYGSDDESGPYVSYTSYDEGDDYEEIEIHVDDFAKAIEAKLREKNGG